MFWSNREKKEHNRKDNWINNEEKELQGFVECTEAEIHLNSLRATHKKYKIGKRQTMMTYMVLVLKIHTLPWQTSC